MLWLMIYDIATGSFALGALSLALCVLSTPCGPGMEEKPNA